MAEETKEKSVEQVETVEEVGASDVEKETTEKTFTQEEVNDIIQKRVAKVEKSFDKKLQEKLDEAEKLRKMNAEQKAEYEAQKQADYVAELEAKINRIGLEKEASKMLSEAGILVDDKILGIVVKDSAESTQEAVNSFSELVNELADKKVSEMLKGKTPKKVGDASTGEITQEQFKRMGVKSRNELFERDPELYRKLRG